MFHSVEKYLFSPELTTSLNCLSGVAMSAISRIIRLIVASSILCFSLDNISASLRFTSGLWLLPCCLSRPSRSLQDSSISARAWPSNVSAILKPSWSRCIRDRWSIDCWDFRSCCSLFAISWKVISVKLVPWDTLEIPPVMSSLNGSSKILEYS